MVKKMQKRWSGRFKFEWDVSSAHPEPINDHNLHFEKYIDLSVMNASPVCPLARLNPREGVQPMAEDSSGVERLLESPEEHLQNTSEEIEEDKKMQNTEDTLTLVPDTPTNNRFGKKEPNLKDSLHEKVYPDEAWSVTSLPKGYECVDAMFMVEAEGTCMLQQEIPVESTEDSLEFSDEESAEELPCPDKEEEETALPSEQEMRTPWSFPLLPGALETEEEKEMMEQKLVLEPRLTENKFFSVSMEYLEDSEDERETKAEAEEKEGEKEAKGCEPSPSSSALHRAVDAQVVCH